MHEGLESGLKVLCNFFGASLGLPENAELLCPAVMSWAQVIMTLNHKMIVNLGALIQSPSS